MTATTATGQEHMADPRMDPMIASQGVMVLAAEDAPNGLVLCAAGGAYSLYRMMETPGVFVALGDDLSAEKVRDALPRIADEGEGLLSWEAAGEHAQRLRALGGGD
jgi:hypothetical protein